jgi:hypothetical protein
MGVWLLTPLSTICQLYRDDQLYWWMNTRRKPPTHRKPRSSVITYCCIQYSSPERELTTSVVIGTDCMDSKYHYHAINTTAVSHLLEKHNILRYLFYFGGKYNISRAAWDTGRLWSLCVNLARLTAFPPRYSAQVLRLLSIEKNNYQRKIAMNQS